MTAGAANGSHVLANESGRSACHIKAHFYLGMWEKYVRRFPSTRILYWESPGISCGRFKSSLGCLLLDVGSELVIISQGQYMRSWFKAVLLRCRTVRPMDSASVSRTDSKTYRPQVIRSHRQAHRPRPCYRHRRIRTDQRTSRTAG